MDLLSVITDFVSRHWGGSFVALFCLILSFFEVSKIKINPWSSLFEKIGRIASKAVLEKVGFIQNQINTMQEQVDGIDQDFKQKIVDDWRWYILEFANSCRCGTHHSKEEWNHLIDILKKYETYCEENDIDNGVMEEETLYLRELYRNINKENDFDN